MKALVINLDGETNRMSFQKQQLQELGIEFERFSAFVLDGVEDPIYKKYQNTWERHLSVSEVSCFFSHKTIWEYIVKKAEPRIVLEDDALLAKNIGCLIGNIEKSTSIDYLNLETRYRRKRFISKQPEWTTCNTDLYRLYQGRSGAGGYILWPSGAKKLLSKIEKEGIGLADKFINSAYCLKAYQAVPAPIIQIDQCESFQLNSPIQTETSIATNSNQNLFSLRSFTFRYRRIIGQLKIGLNLLKHIGHARKNEVKISPFFYE